MAREKKSPGLKILWAWTLGTAAILIASGVRSSMREMEAMMQSDEKQKQLADRLNDSVVIDDAGFQSEGFVKDERQQFVIGCGLSSSPQDLELCGKYYRT